MLQLLSYLFKVLHAEETSNWQFETAQGILTTAVGVTMKRNQMTNCCDNQKKIEFVGIFHLVFLA